MEAVGSSQRDANSWCGTGHRRVMRDIPVDAGRESIAIP